MKTPDNCKIEKLYSVSQKHLSAAMSEPYPVNEETRNRMIAEAAYYRAEARGFVSGHELEDWLEAEDYISHVFQPSWLVHLQY